MISLVLMKSFCSNLEVFEILSIYYDDHRNFDISQLICDKNLIIMFKSNSDYALIIDLILRRSQKRLPLQPRHVNVATHTTSQS